MDLDPSSAGIGAGIIAVVLTTVFGFILRYQKQQNEAAKEMREADLHRDSTELSSTERAGGFLPFIPGSCPAEPDMKLVMEILSEIKGISLRAAATVDKAEKRIEEMEGKVDQTHSILTVRDKNGTPMVYSSRTDTELLQGMKEILGEIRLIMKQQVEQSTKLLEKALR